MKVLSRAADLNAHGRRVCLAIGVFDGVHLGHQQVIRQTIHDARDHEAVATVVTFDPHPAAILAPARVPPSIYPLWQKTEVIESLGADAMLLIRFDLEFSKIRGDDFIRGLARDFGQIASICVGSTFTFGHRRGGNVELLRKLGGQLDFMVHGLAAVALDGDVVSSTRIRNAIRDAKLDAASQMLGRAYALCGTVVRGDQLGRQLGFPTANLDITGLAVPPSGVYAVHAAGDGTVRRGVLNIGHRPTVSGANPELRAEVHLFDFDADLYGKQMRVTFAGKLREEQKFPSLTALQDQIRRDVDAAQKLFARG